MAQRCFSGEPACICDVGFARNQLIGENLAADCVNVNECIDETDDCTENELCFDTDGSYQCNTVPSKFSFPVKFKKCKNSKCYKIQKKQSAVRIVLYARQNRMFYYAGI